MVKERNNVNKVKKVDLDEVILKDKKKYDQFLKGNPDLTQEERQAIKSVVDSLWREHKRFHEGNLQPIK